MKKLPLLILLAAFIAGCAAGSNQYTPPQAQPADIPPPSDLLTAPVQGPQA